MHVNTMKDVSTDHALDLGETLSQQIQMPQLFAHLLEPNQRVGMQSVLLFGPPGTGKTLFAQSLAAKHQMTVFKVQNDKLASKWVGQTEK